MFCSTRAGILELDGGATERAVWMHLSERRTEVENRVLRRQLAIMQYGQCRQCLDVFPADHERWYDKCRKCYFGHSRGWLGNEYRAYSALVRELRELDSELEMDLRYECITKEMRAHNDYGTKLEMKVGRKEDKVDMTKVMLMLMMH